MTTRTFFRVKTDAMNRDIGVAIDLAISKYELAETFAAVRINGIVPTMLTFFSTSPERYEVTEATVFIEMETP